MVRTPSLCCSPVRPEQQLVGAPFVRVCCFSNVCLLRHASRSGCLCYAVSVPPCARNGHSCCANSKMMSAARLVLEEMPNKSVMTRAHRSKREGRSCPPAPEAHIRSAWWPCLRLSVGPKKWYCSNTYGSGEESTRRKNFDGAGSRGGEGRWIFKNTH